jgi:bla regulator protein BlaR1
MITHLWQSTIFAGLVWLAATALRHNGARVRYWLWMAASLKFLVPFSWLVTLGAQIEWRTGPVAAQPVAAFVVDQVLAPSVLMASGVTSTAQGVAPASILPAVAVAMWLMGVVAVCFWWWRQWLPVRAALRAATLLPLESNDERCDLTMMSSPMAMEPGVVGLWRQVLLVPEGLLDQLTPAQVDALIAHERSHARHRDNLMAAVHMVVEALFWFHPVVWWIERRLIDERERACDEDVLRGGSQPSDYAEGILAVCRLSVGAPLACVAGISGSDLRRRVEAILLGGLSRPMGAGRRSALALALVGAVGLPIAAGTLSAVPLITVGQDGPMPAAFAVASIKVNTSGERGSLTQQPAPGTFKGTNVYVTHLIREAYAIEDNQIELAPEWTRSSSSTRFDITAQLEQVPIGGEAEQDRALAQALQRLLAQRFNLVVRRETREVPMHALVMARRDGQPGPLLKRAAFDCSTPEGRKIRAERIAAGGPPGVCGMNVQVGRIRFGSRTMADLAKNMSGAFGRPLIDRTGLTGLWEFELTFMPDQLPQPQPGREAPVIDPNAPPLVTAFEEQLGLKLESTKGTMEVLIVERVDRPTEN